MTALLGLDFGGYFFLGVGAGAVYLFLLGVKVDTIGADYAAKYKLQTKYSDDTNPILKRLANARLLVPLVLLVALSAKDYLDNSYTAQYLQLVTKQQYIASMSGFVSIRFALFISEVTKEIRFSFQYCSFTFDGLYLRFV